MNLVKIVLAVILTVWLATPGAAQSPVSSGGRPAGVSPPSASDVANRSGATKQRQQRRSDSGDAQASDTATDPEDARLTRILNGICRGC